MKRALAAALLSCALAAHAQAPPEPAPETQPAAAPAPEREAAQNPPSAVAPATQASGLPPAEPQSPAKVAAPKPAPPKSPPPEVTTNTHEAELSTLRAEVARLQSELDAERAAAMPAPEEPAAAAPSMRSLWEWLLVTALLALAAGFFLGWRLLDRRIRRKYGGLRIY